MLESYEPRNSEINEHPEFYDIVPSLIQEIRQLLGSDNDPNIESMKGLIEQVLLNTEAMRESRAKTWSESLYKATVQGNIADSLTNVSDETLIPALQTIKQSLQKGVDNMSSEELDHLKKFADQIPSSAYKQSVNAIYLAIAFTAIATAAIAGSVLTCGAAAPILAPIALYCGSAVMGLACHIGIKKFMHNAAEETYDQQRFEVLKTLHAIKKHEVKGGQDQQAQKDELNHQTTVIAKVKGFMQEIQAQKTNGHITPTEASKALKIMHQALQGDEKAIVKFKDLQQHMQFASPIKNPRRFFSDAASFLGDTLGVAAKKYPATTALVLVGTAINAAIAVVAPSLLLQLASSVAVGAAAAIGYEIKQAASVEHKTISAASLSVLT